MLYCHILSNPIDFLNSGSYIMDGIVSLHDHIIFYELIMLIIVCWMLISILMNSTKFPIKDLLHGSILEIIWTLIPGIILILIALPSFRLLYLMDDILEPSLTVKVIGNQWYWTYSIGDNQFDSYLLQDLIPGSLRLLDTDEHLILPSNILIRFLITSTDVLHSWAIPALGIKMDACPGRLNQTAVEIYRPGLYWGACSEICGVQHGFMPISLKVI